MRALLSRAPLAAALLAAMLLAPACGSGGAGKTPISRASTRSAPTDPAQTAQADAANLLAAFVPPPKATSTASEPSATPTPMDTPVSTPALATEAVRTGWWVVDSPADTVYSWLKARLPTDEGAYSASSEGTVGTNVQFVSYSKPPTNLLGQRMVLAAVGSLSATRTVLRVDAQVVYRPVKPAGDEVPVTAYLLATVRPKVPPGAPAPSPISMTVTDRSTIAEIAGLVNALPTRTNGAHSCPLETDAGIYLTFKNDANGAARATVLLHLDGCDGVSVNIGGTVEPRLDPSGTAYPGGFSAEVAHLLGVTSH